MGDRNVVRIGLLGKIQRHQRLETVTSRHRLGNPGTIFLSLPQVTIGGTRLGMTIAWAKSRLVSPSTARRTSPSRKCR